MESKANPGSPLTRCRRRCCLPCGSASMPRLSRPRRARPHRSPHHLRGLDMAWPSGSNPHRESGTRSRAAADVGQASTPRGRLTVGRKDASGTAWATPLGLWHLHSGHWIPRRLHEVVGADQRLAQAIRVLVGQALAVEAGIRGMNDAVVVRADHHDVSADIRAALG